MAVIGAGVAGLTAAGLLAGWGVEVSLFEKSPFLGGHAIQLGCKATDSCVKCGACVAEDQLMGVVRNPKVSIHAGTQIEAISGQGPYQISFCSHSPLVHADRCNGCGICFQKCPVPGAILQGQAPRVGPYVAIRQDLCRFFDDGACSLCRETCPQGAIHLSAGTRSGQIHVDAILVATGFAPYIPSHKPYGYGLFQNVITSLDAERLLREKTLMKRPSDGRLAGRIAFIQCVGSRDARQGHPGCSKICCGSSLRMARLIQSRQNDAQIAFFYIDVQNFGKDFQCFYANARTSIEMIRAIPGDIIRTEKDELEVIYFDPETKVSKEAFFDVVILSVGLLPSGDNKRVARMLNLPLNDSGFISPSGDDRRPSPAGIYTAGAATGPMSIAESVSSAERTVFQIIGYLGLR
ncbi:NAD(P)-binding protein [Desulfosarcina sp.]|uniref:NAD(P)-binding protein n=1 Tax=Desulfosarcina sp. TaxID=2027861 RepID=UPI00397080E6